MLDQRKLNSLICMRKARQAAACGDRAQCLKAFTDAFWLRCTDEDIIDIEYSSFFRYQFRVYLLGRADFLLPLDEGDEICALIRETYEKMKISMDESPFIVDEGEWNLLKSVEIDFSSLKSPTLTA